MIMNFQSMILLLHGMVVSDQWSGLPKDGSHIKCSAQFDHSFSECEPSNVSSKQLNSELVNLLIT